jgi:prepilin-type processing-associated H-X9-DG protein
MLIRRFSRDGGITRGRAAITLIETIVIAAVIAILIGLTVVGVQRARDIATRADCANRLAQLSLALHHFEGVRKKLPEGCGYPFLRTSKDLDTQGGYSWQTAVLPFLDQGSLGQMAWQAQTLDPSTVKSLLHAKVRETTVPVLICPAEPQSSGFNSANGWRWGITSYLGVAGTDKLIRDGVFNDNLTIRFSDITDGVSNTLMIGERPVGPTGAYSAWYASWGDCVCSLNQILSAGNGKWNPGYSSCKISISVFREGRLEELCDLNHFWSLHRGGANFAFADGTVRFLTYDSANIIPALATRAGGEIVQVD